MSDDSTNLRQEFVTELESILESDEAYGSNLQILTYALKEDVINGKFKDSWNNRVYEFIIDIDGISYKPAAKLDSFGADELPTRFDAYSKGYASLFENERLDRNPVGKRVKKPKCGNQGYGCGYSCISLLKTCQILSSGKKAGTNQGKAIGQQRLNKLMELSKKLYLAGDTKKAALTGAIAANISKVRTKYNAGGQGLIAERALAKQQATAKNKTQKESEQKLQEKQLTKAIEEKLIGQDDARDYPNENTRKYYDTLRESIDKGTLSNETKQNIKDYVEWLHEADSNSKVNLKYKQERILSEMKGEPEAAFALAAYIHGPSFRNMNAILWRKDIDNLNTRIKNQENRSSDEFTKQYIALDVGAAKALKSLPALSRDTLKEQYKDYEIDTEKFHRYMSLPEGGDLNGFLKDHKPGDTIEYHSFQSYTVFAKPDATPEIAAFSESANIKYTLTRKENTQAKAMDQFKNKAIEGEVLYPPGTKFKVTNVEEIKSEKFDFYPFSSISKSKKDQKKTTAFIEKIPQPQWDSYVSNIRDSKLKEILTNIRNKDPKSFNDDFKFFANTQDYAESKNLLFLMLEKAGVKLDKSPGASKHHIHMEEV